MTTEELILEVEKNPQALALVEEETPRILSRGKLKETQIFFEEPVKKGLGKSKT